MSLLIQLRYRIKAIETIKKITHAMRLISMSSRSRLKSKEDALTDYMATSQQFFERIQKFAPDWQSPLTVSSDQKNPLIILIGSQRGLCGNFNTVLFHFFEKSISKPENNGKIQIIVVGKKAINYVHDNSVFNVVAQFPDLHAKTIGSIASQILHILMKNPTQFNPVTVFSNRLKTFFIQKPHEQVLIPFSPLANNTQTNSTAEYYWEQNPKELLDQLAYQTIEAQLYYLIFESLLAEHAARFISMDNATRNAQTLLEDNLLQYNKLRQAKITKELTELVSSM